MIRRRFLQSLACAAFCAASRLYSVGAQISAGFAPKPVIMESRIGVGVDCDFPTISAWMDALPNDLTKLDGPVRATLETGGGE